MKSFYLILSLLCFNLISVKSYGQCTITANAGPDYTTCTPGLFGYTYLSGVVQGATGGVWTTTGTGTITDPNSLITPYTPSAADISSGSVTFTLTTTGNGSCPAASDNVIITLVANPTVDAGLHQTICTNADAQLSGTTNASIKRWTTTGTGTFSPNYNDLNAIYEPSSADTSLSYITITLTADNGTCQASDVIQLDFTPDPYVKVGIDTGMCASSTFTTINSVVDNVSTIQWSTQGTGTFTNGNNVWTTYTPSASDIVAGSVNLTLTATSATCPTVTKTLHVTMFSDSYANAGLDQVVDKSVANVQLNGSIQNAHYGHWSIVTGDGSFTPYSGTLNAQYIPSTNDVATGFVKLALSASNGGCTGRDTMLITFANVPPSQISGNIMAGTNLATKVFVGLYKQTNSTYLLADSVISNSGNYIFSNLLDGNYLIYAYPTSQSPVYSSYSSTYLGGTANWQTSEKLQIAGSNSSITVDDISLIPFTSPSNGWNAGNDFINGTVDLNGNNLKTAAGISIKSVSNATVYLYDNNNNLLAYRTTGRDGTYSFTNLIAGTYTLKCSYPGAQDVVSQSILVDGNPSTTSSYAFIIEKQEVATIIKTSTLNITEVNSYPNPAMDYINLELTNPGDYNLSIINGEGTVVYENNISLNGSLFTLPTNQLNSGIYLIKLTQEGKLYKTKFYKQ